MPAATSPIVEVKELQAKKNGTTTTTNTAMEQSTLIRQGVGLRGVNKNLVSPGYTLVAHLTSPGTVRLIANDGTEAHRVKTLPFPSAHLLSKLPSH